MTKKVLVIDDEPGITKLLETLLSEEGYRVITASDGQTGLNLIDRCNVDLIILDLMMPDMSGWEVLKRLQDHHPLQHAPVAILSASYQDVAIERAKSVYGACAYITKPFKIQELLQTVESILNPV